MQRTSVITGALGGIGSALCKVFRNAGYRVLATDRKQGDCSCDEFLCEDIRYFCEESSRLAAFIEHCVRFTGDAGLHVLINNAAVQILNHVQEIDEGMPQILLKQAKQASPWMMLCGVSVMFNSLGDVLGLMSCKRSSENRQVLVGFQSTEAFGCLHHAGGGPAQCHRGVSPSLHVATDAAHGPHHVLN